MTTRTVDFRERNKQHDSIILVCWMSGLDTYDIAVRLGLPESVIANRLFHAREIERRGVAS
jgi:DNA-directed RNA polymerase specialized sigma24 family protein